MNQAPLSSKDHHILATYKRFPVTFVKGEKNYLFDNRGKKYLDFAGGIAVNSLGHANPEIIEALTKQAKTLGHISNLYYNYPQIELADKLNDLVNSNGRVFFCNSGTEANECLIKLARKFGNESGRNKIITATNSFHGRTFGGMSATGQLKIKAGFEPLLSGFTHVPFNDEEALEAAISEDTCAVLIEGIQGEAGIIPAKESYLKFIREITFKNNILFLYDAVQCGFFRSGKFQSYQAILKDPKGFAPDGIAMAKSLGAGFPIGATWISNSFHKILGAGTHGSTFGGNPIACAVALKACEIIERDKLDQNAATMGAYLIEKLKKLQTQHPEKMVDIRGMGLMLGVELANLSVPENFKDLTLASYATLKALEIGLLVVPAGTHTLRILPALNISKEEVDIALNLFSQLIDLL